MPVMYPCVVGWMAMRRSGRRVGARRVLTARSTPHGVTVAPRLTHVWPYGLGSMSNAAPSPYARVQGGLDAHLPCPGGHA
jgi:hypothetical protein